MKKIYLFLLSLLVILIFLIIYLLQDSQNKLTLKIKSSIPKQARYIIKDSINLYLNNFGVNLKFIQTEQTKSSKGNFYNISEYNNKLLDYQGPRAYLGFKNDKLFLVSGTGVITYTDIENLIKKKNFKLKNIRSNLKEIIEYKDFFLNSSFGVKGILFDGNSVYISISNEIKKDCYNISVLKSEINLKNLNFFYLFNPNECVKKINEYGEFQPIQSGGAMSKFDNNSFLLTTGEFRFRDHAQSDDSVFGKVLQINKNTGDYSIISKGHRNSQGIHYDQTQKVILSTEHGPLGGDEVNINQNIFDKNNYGWPISSYGEHYPKMTPKNAYEKAPLHKSHAEYGFIEPIKYFVPSIGISKIIKADAGFKYSEHHNYFFSSMGYKDRVHAQSIHNLVLDRNYNKIIFEDKIKINYRVRDIVYIPKLKIIIGYLEKRGSLITLSTDEK